MGGLPIICFVLLKVPQTPLVLSHVVRVSGCFCVDFVRTWLWIQGNLWEPLWGRGQRPSFGSRSPDFELLLRIYLALSLSLLPDTLDLG